MKMTLRWYGPGYDTVALKDIKQIPSICGERGSINFGITR